MLIELKGNDLLKLRDAQSVTIHVHAGLVWLTEEGRRSDAFLNAGSRYVVEGNGLVLVETLVLRR